ncbi:MAG TPA: glycosyltransferase 87 family protein [Acidimicrobiales bacterium]|nr:glycosyltransferase 87 family protein [Acidimicrobiales bacterium]
MTGFARLTRNQVTTEGLRAWTAWSLSRAFGLAGSYGGLIYGMRGVITTRGDVNLYFLWSVLFQHGYLPYKTFPIVYPPGIVPALVLPTPSFFVYLGEFLVAALAVDAAVFALLRRRGLAWGASAWLVGAVLIGPVFWSRLDVFVAGALVAAAMEVRSGRSVRAAAWLGVAASIKVWPLLLVLPLLLRLSRRARWQAAAAGLAVPGVLTLGVLAIGGGPGLWHAIRDQAGRGLEVESLFAWPIEMARALGLSTVGPVQGLAWQFTGKAATDLGDAATGLLLVGVGFWALRCLRRPAAFGSYPELALGLSALIVATGKVLSAQYALWVLAAVATVIDGVEPRVRYRLAAWSGFFFLTTQALFPFFYISLLRGGWLGGVPATLHLVATIGLLWSSLSIVRGLPTAAIAEPGPIPLVQIDSVPEMVTL